MPKTITIELVRKYLADQCTPEEIEQVNAWFSSYQYYPNSLTELTPEMKEALENKLFEKITRDIQKSNPNLRVQDNNAPYPSAIRPKHIFAALSPRAIGIAASLLILLSSTLYLFYFLSSHPLNAKVAVTKTNDLAPGGNRAILKLSNGKTIVLDSAHNGVLATQGNISISKTRNGHIIYTIKNGLQTTVDDAKINTITTPTGGQYQVALPDGTQAWLNSRSSLSFPARFSGKERRVEMSGEVYFEVAKNAAMPFKVQSKGTEVEVLGTHFNIMAYDDETEQKTTLLEGSVKISTAKAFNILKPGQQAVIAKSGEMHVNSNVNLENVIAWKNGLFDFKNMDLAAIMRQASRWYGISVTYKGQTAGMTFTGRIPKDVNLSELLNMLQYTGIKYKLEGKIITFSPEHAN